MKQATNNYWLYILKSQQSGKFYVGQTNNLEKRFLRHRNGETNFGRRNKDISIVCEKCFNDRSKAAKLEAFIKRQKSHKFIERMLKNDINFPR